MYTQTLEDASPEGFRLFLERLGVAPGAQIVALKGYNDGMENEKYHAEALAELRKLGASVLVWDGQWQKAGCFTTVTVADSGVSAAGWESGVTINLRARRAGLFFSAFQEQTDTTS